MIPTEPATKPTDARLQLSNGQEIPLVISYQGLQADEHVWRLDTPEGVTRETLIDPDAHLEGFSVDVIPAFSRLEIRVPGTEEPLILRPPGADDVLISALWYGNTKKAVTISIYCASGLGYSLAALAFNFGPAGLPIRIAASWLALVILLTGLVYNLVTWRRFQRKVQVANEVRTAEKSGVVEALTIRNLKFGPN